MECPLVRLGDIVYRLTNGFVGATRNIYQDDGVPYLLARQVKNNVLKFDKKTYVSNEFNIKNKKSILKKGDVLLVQSGHIGHSAVVPEKHEGDNCHAMIVITPHEKLSGEFLSLYFHFLLLTGKILEIRTGSTVPHLTCKLVKELQIPLPAISEQIRIVALLDTVFADLEQTRAKTEQNLKNARELMNVTFQEAITGKLTKLWREANQNVVSASELLTKLKEQKNQLVNEKVISKEKVLPRLPKEEAPYELPVSWLWCRLGEIGNATNYPFVDGPFGSSINTKTDYIETGVPVLRMVNVKPFTYKNYNLKYVNEDKYQQFTRHNVLPGDVLFSKVGAGTGESCVVPDDFLYGMLSTTGITRIRVGQVVLNQYLCCFLNSNIKTFMVMASKAAQPFLNMTQIKTFPFPLPPIEEQSEIVLMLERLSTEIQQVEAIYEKKLLALDELKKSILQKAFNGELTAAAK
jgi:type I restriction enzyme S subunit